MFDLIIIICSFIHVYQWILVNFINYHLPSLLQPQLAFLFVWSKPYSFSLLSVFWEINPNNFTLRASLSYLGTCPWAIIPSYSLPISCSSSIFPRPSTQPALKRRNACLESLSPQVALTTSLFMFWQEQFRWLQLTARRAERRSLVRTLEELKVIGMINEQPLPTDVL